MANSLRSACAALVIAASFVNPAWAQAYPAKPIRLVIPYAAGGSTDTLGRIFAEKLHQRWGQPVVVDNRAGGGTAIGAEYVAKAPPDGYTLMIGSVPTFGINPHLLTKWPLDSLKSFTPVTLLGTTPVWLLVHPSLPVKSVRELGALARRRPGELTVGLTGLGSTGHLALELWKAATGLDLIAVPYKGSTPGMAALVGGETSAMFDVLGPSMPYVKAGRVRPLALIQAKRSALVPEMPTFAELGFSDIDIVSYFGVVAPAGTPAAIRDKLVTELKSIGELGDVKQRMAILYVEPVLNTPDEFSAQLVREFDYYGKLIRNAKIKID